MNTAYFQLRSYCKQQGTSFALQNLADYWLVSAKQAKRRLQRYQQAHYLRFFPGSGRGHLSRVIFYREFQEELNEAVTDLLAAEKLTELSDLLRLEVPTEWLQPFYDRFRQHFRLQETDDEKIVLNRIQKRPLTTLDPVKVSIHHEVNLLYQICDCLTKDVAGNAAPGLAHHWVYEKSDYAWRFSLRKGVLFHHGKTMTSRDVVYTFERIKNVLPQPPWQLQNLLQIVATGEYEVTFFLKHAEPLFPVYLASVLFVILPADRPFDALLPSGTGAFQIQENSTKRVVLKAFDRYYGLRPLIDEVRYLMMPFSKISQAEFTEQNEYLEAGYQMVEQKDEGVEFLIPNLTRRTLIQNPLIRQALFEICDMTAVSNREGRAAVHYHPDTAVYPKKSLKKARKLLEKAAYQGEVLFCGVLAHYHSAAAFGEWLKKRSEEVGLVIELVYFSFEEHFYTDFLEKNVDLVLFGDVPVIGEVFPYLEFIASPMLLLQRFLPAAAKKKLAEDVSTYKLAPAKKRQEIYLRIDDWLIKENYLIYLLYPQRTRYIHPMLIGLTESEQIRNDYRLAWKE